MQGYKSMYKSLSRDCHFIESLEHGYFLYANAYNSLWRIGFTKGFKPVGPKHLQRPQTLHRACFLFVKIDAELFDRDMFTTTTYKSTTTTSIPKTPTIFVNRRLSENSISGSNLKNINDNNKQNTANKNKKSGPVLSYQVLENLPFYGKKSIKEQKNLARRRKQNTKFASPPTTPFVGIIKPKNLVRHHHNNKTLLEEKHPQNQPRGIPKLRLQTQRLDKKINVTKASSIDMTNATNSASSASLTYTLTTTASLAPSALNIFAMLAASRRKRGRRKKEAEEPDGSSDESPNMQLCAQSPLKVQTRCYDEISAIEYKSRKLYHKHQLRHYYNYLYLQQHLLHERGVTLDNGESCAKNRHGKNHEYSNKNYYITNNLNHNYFHNIVSALPKKHKANHSKFNDGKRSKETMTEYHFSNKRKLSHISNKKINTIISKKISKSSNIHLQLLLTTTKTLSPKLQQTESGINDRDHQTNKADFSMQQNDNNFLQKRNLHLYDQLLKHYTIYLNRSDHNVEYADKYVNTTDVPNSKNGRVNNNNTINNNNNNSTSNHYDELYTRERRDIASSNSSNAKNTGFANYNENNVNKSSNENDNILCNGILIAYSKCVYHEPSPRNLNKHIFAYKHYNEYNENNKIYDQFKRKQNKREMNINYLQRCRRSKDTFMYSHDSCFNYFKIVSYLSCGDSTVMAWNTGKGIETLIQFIRPLGDIQLCQKYTSTFKCNVYLVPDRKLHEVLDLTETNIAALYISGTEQTSTAANTVSAKFSGQLQTNFRTIGAAIITDCQEYVR
uniref:Uncharacterized protein n=1 Tax=Glossina brevipalpis TaxID=37001 RepID=A0A1A9WW45_9MUSC